MKNYEKPDGPFIALAEEEWEEQYPLVSNHFQPDEGDKFETFGEESEFVNQQDESKVWTLVDNGEGGDAVLSGFHSVNSLGYFVSTRPRSDDTQIVVARRWSDE